MRLLTILGLAATTAFVPAAQSLSGRWSAAPQPGMTITFDLSVAGAVVTGTMAVTKQDGGSAIGSVEQGTTNGTTFSSVDKPQAPALILRRENASSAPPATAATTPAGWRSTARSASLVDGGGRTVLNVAAAPGEGVVRQEPSALQDGTIDVELRGRDIVGQSFLGVAFRGLDERTYEAVYFRPFNFATVDADRRLRAVPYESGQPVGEAAGGTPEPI
jgi:hypothetical protein